MAAVTVVSTLHNVTGNRRSKIFKISGSSGDTLDVGMRIVNEVLFEPGTNTPTSVARTASTPAAGNTRLTFTSGGAFSNQIITVIGN